MPDYKKMYTLMFNAATDAMEQLEQQNFEKAKELLVLAQQQAEEIYMDED